MTNPHPLTDEMCELIACTGTLPPPLTDEKYCDIAGSMRAAADWQLEQVLTWLYENLYWIEEDGSVRYVDSVNPASGKYVVFDHYRIIDDLKKAMRSQEES